MRFAALARPTYENSPHRKRFSLLRSSYPGIPMRLAEIAHCPRFVDGSEDRNGTCSVYVLKEEAIDD